MTIKVGIVGARGLSTLAGFKAIPDTEVVALCDLNEAFLEAQAAKHGIACKYRIYEDMLASDIDAVVIATPMQYHVPQSIQALEAGKHVLCEVTAGVTMDELWWLKEAVESSGKVYMMAENYCYIPENQLVLNMIRKGLFGEIYFGEGEYLHDIRDLAIHEHADTGASTATWRKYWQLGKRGAFYPTHSIGPLMQWFEGDRIRAVASYGCGRHTDKRFRQEDTSITLCQLESGKLLKLRLDCISKRPHNMSYYTVQGTKGCFESPRGLGDRHKIWLESEAYKPNHAEWQPLELYRQHMPERYLKATENQLATGHWGGDYFIVADFADAIRHNGKPPIDVYDACEWTAVALLSELSIMNNGRMMDMPDFRKSGDVREQITKL